MQTDLITPRYILKMFDRLLRDARLPHMRFHDLRHSAATLLLSMGVNPKVAVILPMVLQVGETMVLQKNFT